MKKKMLSILLALAMVVSLLPAKVQADTGAGTEPNYFCITNTSNEEATVTWTCKGDPYLMNLFYKIGEGAWSVYYGPGFGLTVPAKTSVYFKAQTDSISPFSKYDDTYRFDEADAFYSISCDKPHTASGDITTLLRSEGNVTDLTVLEEEGDYVFASLFSGDTYLTSAENLILPSVQLTPSCYMDMFFGCTSLEKAPKLPASALAHQCYFFMFYGCTSLTEAPELSASVLAEVCYEFMFAECTKLKAAPELTATTLTKRCYRAMFYGCTSLNSIKMLATDISADYCLECWVSNVASNGTFTKSAQMTTLTTGDGGIPDGWTVQNSDGSAVAVPEYTICFSYDDGKGEVSADKDNAAQGETVTLTVTPVEGYKLKSLTVKAGEDNIEVANNTFTMPAADVTVAAEFEEITSGSDYYSISITGDIENGTVTADKATAAPGEEVTLTVSPNEGYKLKSLTVKTGTDDIEVPNYTFTMPAADVTVTAEFEEIVVIYYSIYMAGDTENGTVTADKATAAPGEEVTLTVTLNEGYSVKSLTAKAGETPITINYVHDGEYTFTMPDGDVDVEFVFGILFNISFSCDPAKGTVSSNVKGACPPGDIITLTATPNPGCEFIRWESDDVEIENGCFTMPNHHVHIKAVFSGPGAIYLDTNGPGTVSADKTIAEEGEVVTLSVTPNPGYEFLYWQSDVEIEIEEGRFTMPDHSVYITPVFGVTYTVTVTAGENGTTSVDKIKAYDDKEVFLSAQPNSGYRLVGWESDDVTVKENTFTMPAKNVSVKAIFEPVTLVPSVAYRYPVTDGKNVVFNDDGTVKFADGNQSTCTLVDGKTILWTEGWYVVNGKVDIDERITVSGNVNLILSDGCELNANSGITVSGEENSLTIYGQSAGTGTLNAERDNMIYAAAIGGGESQCDGNNITINGGTIIAGKHYSGADPGAGIGGGDHGDGINITINGGNVTAIGDVASAGIGGGAYGDGKDITINGGTVYAEGGCDYDDGCWAAGIGAGCDSDSINIFINGGKVTAVGRIGIGGDLGSENIVIKNSIVKAGADAANATTISADVVTEKELNNAAYVIIEPANENQGSGNEGQGSGNENQGSGNEGQGSGNENQGSGNEGQGSGNENQGSGNEGQGSGNSQPAPVIIIIAPVQNNDNEQSTDTPVSTGTSEGTETTDTGKTTGTEQGSSTEGSASESAGSSETAANELSAEVTQAISELSQTKEGAKAAGLLEELFSADEETAAAQSEDGTKEQTSGEAGADKGTASEGSKVSASLEVSETAPADAASGSLKDGVFVGSDGKTITNSFVESTKTGRKYFADENGNKVTNAIVTDGENLYYCDEKGVVQTDKAIDLGNGKTVLADETGAIITKSDARVRVGGKAYITGENGMVQKDAAATIKAKTKKNGKTVTVDRTYILDEDGNIRTGLVEFEGKTYITSKTGIVRKNKVTTVNGEKIYTDENGEVVRNKEVTYKGKKYMADENGYLTVIE